MSALVNKETSLVDAHTQNRLKGFLSIDARITDQDTDTSVWGEKLILYFSGVEHWRVHKNYSDECLFGCFKSCKSIFFQVNFRCSSAVFFSFRNDAALMMTCRVSHWINDPTARTAHADSGRQSVKDGERWTRRCRRTHRQSVTDFKSAVVGWQC